MDKVLITGASGFIGTNVLEYFYSFGYAVTNIDNKKPINQKHEKFWQKTDITDYECLLKVVKEFNPDYIIHLAARTDLKGKTLEDYSANTIGVDNILKVSKELLDLRKIIVASSQLVCGLGYKPKDQFDYHPSTIYGESKVITEKTVWNNMPHCDWAIIRPTSIWGEWFDMPYKNFFDMVIAKQYFHIGKKSCTKTYGYVGNAVYQIEKILLSDTTSKNNKIFYIGDYQPTNIEEWANEIAHILNYRMIRMPYSIIRTVAFIGDLLNKIDVSFPMTTFRLHNMITSNIVDLSTTRLLAPELPYTRIQGILETLKWLNVK